MRLARLDGVAENPEKVAPFLFQFYFALADTRNFDEIIHQPDEMLDLPLHHREQFFRVEASRPMASEHMQAVADRRQGIPQFMGERRQKFVLSTIGVLQPLLDLLALANVPRHHLDRLLSLPEYGRRDDFHRHPRSIKPHPNGLVRSEVLLLVNHETHPLAHLFMVAWRYDVKR